MQFDVIIRNGQCVTPSGIIQTDLGIRAGKIAAIGQLEKGSAPTIIDARHLHVLPGIIDSQVHFREPGLTHKEDLESGTRGAVLGGVTAICEMPNTNPPTTTPEALEDKLARAKGRAWCNYAFYVGGTPDPDAPWAELERLPGCAGIKIFMGASTGSLLVEEDAAIEAILRNGRRRVAVHAEDNARMNERKKLAEEGAHPMFHPVWRDEESALNATSRLLKLARKTGRPVHVLHITTAEEMDLLSAHKDIATVEVLPQHLTFTAEDYERLGTLLQMNPPIRARRHRKALWQAVQDGIVDVVGSDHAPHTLEEKAKPYPQSPSGMPGVQTILPVMLHHVARGKLTLLRMVDLLSAGPARVLGMAGKGRISVGYDADLTLVDLSARHTITNKAMATKSGWTPFDGSEVTGWPTHTIVGGHVVMQHGELTEPAGTPIHFIDTLAASR